MVSVCLPSDALSQHLPSYLGFSYLGRGVSLHSCFSKAQPLLLTLNEGYLPTAALPDLQRGIAPLGPPAPVQPRLFGCGVGTPGRHTWPWVWDCSSWLRAWGHGVASPGNLDSSLYVFQSSVSHDVLCFAGAAKKRYPMSKVRETQVRR